MNQKQVGASSSRVEGLGNGCQLPPRNTALLVKESRSLCSGGQEVDLLAGKATVVLSRIVKVEAGVQQLLDMDADVLLVQALQKHIQDKEQAVGGFKEGNKHQGRVHPDGAGMGEERLDGQVLEREWLDAAVRCVCALLSRCLERVEKSSSRSNLPKAAAEVLLKVMADPAAGDTVAGNAALGLSYLANCSGLEDIFRGSQAVHMLVEVMKKGKGDVASRNAAITLAKLARDAAMLEQLRELRGLEVMYQYIKP
jgi:hypothetical protein